MFHHKTCSVETSFNYCNMIKENYVSFPNIDINGNDRVIIIFNNLSKRFNYD